MELKDSNYAAMDEKNDHFIQKYEKSPYQIFATVLTFISVKLIGRKIFAIIV